MRPAVSAVVLSFATGICAGSVFPVSPLICFIAATGLAVIGMRWWRVFFAACLFAGWFSGSIAGLREASGCRLSWQRGNRSAVVRILDAPGRNGVTTAKVIADPEGCTGTIRVQVAPEGLQSGVTLVAVGVVRGRGVFRIDHARRLRVRRPLRFVLRDAVRSRVVSLYGHRAAIVEAMILGRRHDLRSDTRDAFVASGLAHLLAISGLHVGIVAALVTISLRRFSSGARPWAWAAGLTWAYVTLLGFPTPATRAALFITIAACSRIRGRNPPLEVVIGVSVLCILCFDPLAVRSVGAWLSVFAVWSTARSIKLARTVTRRSGRWGPLVRLAVASAGATIGTAPITAFVFGNVAPIGLVANLIAVPLASMAVPAVFISLLGGPTFAAGAGVLLALLESTASLFGSIPGGHLEGVPGVAFALPWTVLAGVAVWLAVRPPVWRLALRRAAYGLGAVGWVAAVLPAIVSLRHRGILEVHMLDVGQGDAIAIKTPNDRWVLIDGGPKNLRWDAGLRVVVPFLKRRGVRFLDAVILSHGDADHLGGLPAVVQNVPTGVVLEPGVPLGSSLYVEFLDVLDEEGVEWLSARAGDTLLIDSVRFAVLHPHGAWLEKALGPNENSLVVHVSYREFDLLLTGDIGWPAESTLIASVSDIEVLKVGHHGSRGGTRNAWLEALRPEVAMISVGQRNRYGHPAPDVVRRLQDRGIHIVRTDTDGAVTLRSDGRYYELVTRGRVSFAEKMLCLLPTSLLSNVSSSIRSVCSRRPRGNSRVSFTISP